MYIPKHYNGKDQEEAISFMQRFNFGTIVTNIDQTPVATHLPLVIIVEDNEVKITSHFAKANKHWKHIENNESLIIFSEPHAYISPVHYEKKKMFLLGTISLFMPTVKLKLYMNKKQLSKF